ncbi:MAG: hypothetical protein ABSC23_17315 [Bryobacteraceae bacterium]
MDPEANRLCVNQDINSSNPPTRRFTSRSLYGKKRFRNLAVSQIAVRTLENMNLKRPKPAAT